VASPRLEPAAAACVWRGDFGSGHSLAVVNDGHVSALEAAGVAVERIGRLDAPSTSTAVGVAGHWPPSFQAPSAGPFVLYQPWEFGCVPGPWVEPTRRSVDEVWTPSNASRESFLAAGIAPELVHVVPNGVDAELFSPTGPRRELPVEAGTVFLFVGGLTHRKGIDVLLEAYGRAFTADDDVALVLKSFGARTYYRGQAAFQLVEELMQRPGAPRLVLLDEDVPHAELPALYRAADCLVQPYRGEGFCLPALEALACGLPLIVTAGGSTDDFVSDDCAWRIPAGRSVLPRNAVDPDLLLAAEGFLLEPSVPELVAAFQAAADPAARAARAATSRAHAERFSNEAVARVAADRLAALSGRRPVREIPVAEVPDARRVLLTVPADWDRPETWVEPVRAYAEAFGPGDDTTLVLPAADEAAALALVAAELERAGHELDTLADVALADAAALDPASLELAADAVICASARPLGRARRIVPPHASALRALLDRR
jgi:glycosyltransferase involved in cell wall biosynthesis